MIAVRLFSRGEIVSRLAPYKCRHISDLGDGLEIWETGCGYPFTLQSQGQRYDEWQYRRILASRNCRHHASRLDGWKRQRDTLATSAPPLPVLRALDALRHLGDQCAVRRIPAFQPDDANRNLHGRELHAFRFDLANEPWHLVPFEAADVGLLGGDVAWLGTVAEDRQHMVNVVDLRP